MRIDVVTLFPDMIRQAAMVGVLGRAIDRKLLDLCCWNPRDDATDVHATVDDRPFGGGPGMVMKVEPLRTTLRKARNAVEDTAKVIYLSPQGQKLDQKAVQSFAKAPRLILLAGRYEGIDERLIEADIDEEWSIGDYVLSGGELPALVMIDAISRWLPGVLGHAESAQQDSFSDGLLDCPQYTRPEVFEGLQVPKLLLSGHHQEIARWRRKMSLGRTWQRRKELLELLHLSKEDQQLLEEYMLEQKNHPD